jgi:hypothetical protein
VDLVSREGREGLSRESTFLADFVGEDDADEARGTSEALVVAVDFFLLVKRDGIGLKPEAEQPICESPLWWSYFFLRLSRCVPAAMGGEIDRVAFPRS